MKVLMVEDDRATRSMLEDALTSRGYEVASFGDAESAWEICQHEPFDLMVLDWMLPGMDGLELCRRVRSSAIGDATTVLIITARNSPHDLAEVLGAGADDYLSKPFDLRALEIRLAVAEKQVIEAAERRQAEEALARQALQDPLTELPNRNLLRDRLAQAVLAARRDKRPVAVLMIDLDHFKEVNDTLGHHAGDSVLLEVAQRLRGGLRESDTVSRFGGDEFAAVLIGANATGAVHVAEKLIQTLTQPFVVEGQTFPIGASIGIAIYPEHGEDIETLLRRADAAMYVAKRSGSGLAVYASP